MAEEPSVAASMSPRSRYIVTRRESGTWIVAYNALVRPEQYKSTFIFELETADGRNLKRLVVQLWCTRQA